MSDNGMIAPSSLVMLSPQQISSELGGEIVIMDLKNGIYHGVDGVSAFIWNQLARPIFVRDVCDRVAAEYDVDLSRCETDVIALIQQLLDEGLVKLVYTSPAKVSLS
jgi:Coenzyme PQQ synthesis protein D (PqqD)